MRYMDPDDYGDWVHEVRRDKELDRKWYEEPTMAMKDTAELSLHIDALGRLQAEQRKIDERIKRLKATVLAEMSKAKLKRANGELFGVVRIEKDIKRVDWKTVAERMNAPRQLVTAHTKTSHSEYVQVGTRKTEEQAA